LKAAKMLFYLQLMVVLLLATSCALTRTYGQSLDEKIAYVHDIISPSLDEVKWSEEGALEQAPTWIADGSWYALSIQQSLVNTNDIFVSWYEQFNWSVVLSTYVPSIYDLPFRSASVEDLVNYSISNPNWWVSYMWKLDTQFCGISENTSKVTCDFNGSDSEVEMWIWFHITRIPEYFVSRGGLQNWLTGFDLTPVSTGNLKAWEFYQDWNTNGTHYNLYFRAPANVLSQHGDNFTFSVGVSSFYAGRTVSNQQVIDVNMPPNTEVKEAMPASMIVMQGNTASFVKAKGDEYPQAFTVVSGPPAKSFAQAVVDGASVWFLTPSGWAAIGSLLVLSFTALRGRRIWHRSKLYHRLYKSLVTIYDMYAKDLIRFHQEMDIISRNIVSMLIEDRINDEQFEKLLQRRDDLLRRAHE